MLRHKRNQKEETRHKLTFPDVHHPLIYSSPHPQSDPAMTTMGWQQTPPDGHGPHLQTPQQQLSVVTTVWGVPTTTQSGPLTHSCYAGTNISTAQTPYPQNQHGYLGNSEDIPSKVFPLQNMAGRQVGLGYSSYKMAPTSVGGPAPSPGNGHHVDYQNSSGALSAAALVARAAATATATATASVVAFQEQQQEAVMGAQYSGQMHSVKDQQQYHGATGNPYLSNGLAQTENSMISMNESSGVMNNSMMNSGNSVNPFDSQMGMNESMSVNNQLPKVGMQLVPNMGSGGSSMYPGPTVEMGSQHRNRVTPYPSPVQHLAEKRHSQYSTSVIPQYNANMQPYGFDAQHSYSPSQYPGAQSSQFVKQPHQYSPFIQQQPLPSTPYPPQQTVQPSMRPPFMAQQNQYYPSAQINSSTPQQMLYEQQTYNGNTYSNPSSYQHRLISYQQSPISAHPTPPPLTSASVITSCFTSNHGDIKSMVHQEKYDEMRLTFPVRDGTILPSFRLEHNLAVSNHFFQLKPSIYQTLLMRSDLELQLKCFHHEDRQMSTNWPSSVQVSINAIPITIDRGENKTSHRPLYVKKMSQSGRNTIQITVTACCCSHLFLLQLVHQPTLRSVVQGLLRKRLLPAELCVLRIKRNFNNVAASGDGVEQTAIKVSLKCPITFKRINLPARGEDCKHIQCFDVQSYLQLNCERESWRCPVCNKTAMLEKLEIDQYMWAVLNKLSKSEVEEITIDDLASWKPVPLKLVKEEHEQDACGGQKLFKAMSPGSMTMPTSNSWDAGQAMSPYSSVTPPDMNSIANDHVNSGANYRGMEVNYDFPPKFSGPLSNLSDSVTSLDPLVAMETSLNQHEQQMCHSGSIHDHPLDSSGPATTTTPSSQQSNNPASQRISQHRPLTPRNSGPPSVPSSSGGNCCSNEVNRIGSNGSYSQSSINNNSLPDAPDLSDLNIAAIFDSDSHGPEDDNDRSQEDLNLLPETVVDPMELLSYLEPPTLCGNSCTTTSTTATNNSVGNISTSNSTSEDILSLFET
ncbi:zinc finger MIZ domain-containing protein 1-like isoform X2 [Tachypleus tridentatus]